MLGFLVGYRVLRFLILWKLAFLHLRRRTNLFNFRFQFFYDHCCRLSNLKSLFVYSLLLHFTYDFNLFQIDTVAYHLCVLKDRFPNGINLLSLFSGIGGAEIALHRLGIRTKNVVSVEISAVSRTVVRTWWEQTNQKGNLYHLADVQELNAVGALVHYINTFGGFCYWFVFLVSIWHNNLVVGGSPCNNLAGSNRYHRDVLEGKESSLFYDYFRILDLVKGLMARYS
ncbi:putative DNA (cytosine-5-)-methyltransferase [Rosa chinensis]|uniref:Putative DNA (Cytosine-5-)-methyltransferase n=1 Tax=Rosa chinensis TaxID=74649 RepID=A0A2P6S5M4_ROSCH|nr:putative DNA (cytosine-5-)-methyltransferase [Rosa chinensis]